MQRGGWFLKGLGAELVDADNRTLTLAPSLTVKRYLARAIRLRQHDRALVGILQYSSARGSGLQVFAEPLPRWSRLRRAFEREG